MGMLSKLKAALDEARGDDEVRAVVIAQVGGAARAGGIGIIAA